MTALNVARFVNLLIVALFVGNEVGSRLVIHPSLNSLSFEADLEAEQALSRNFGRIMPVVMVATIASTVVGTLLARRGRSRLFRPDACHHTGRKRSNQRSSSGAHTADTGPGLACPPAKVGLVAQHPGGSRRGRPGRAHPRGPPVGGIGLWGQALQADS